MGLLSLGTPFKWDEAKKYADYIRDQGIEQLIHIYNNTKDRTCDTLLWGDEVESMVVNIDPAAHEAHLSLRQSQILDKLAEAEKSGKLSKDNVSFHPEYGRYMLESVPGSPFTGDAHQLLEVESNMKKRREVAKEHMNETEYPLNITSYPLLGVNGFCDPYTSPGLSNPASKSFFLPDEMINTHVRFPTLTANIRRRRGSKVAINVPIFKDTKTPSPFIDPTIPWDRDIYPEDANARDGAAKPDHIYMDSMGFGMGCCCLQITFQATDISEARNLYDQLAAFTPVFLALSAASPAYRGYLADQDARWNVIAGSVDDRTPVERGEKEDPDYAGPNSSPHIPKSRYDSIDCYISDTNPALVDNAEHYNDSKLVINNKVKARLLEAGFDELLANHFAHLFIRDPIVIFQELLNQDNAVDSDHFENIQSTNWQTLRFKPPPPNSKIGWRVEFRPMEIQFTDFENAANSIMIVLLTRVIISYKLNFLLPISKVDENMRLAHKRDAVSTARFWFRTNIFSSYADAGEYAQLTVNEIVNGCEQFIGLIPLVQRYLQTMSIDLESLCKLDRYLSLISKRASGKLMTTAQWIRNFVRTHPNYQFDSRITPDINYDLVTAIRDLTDRATPESEALLGGLHVA